MFSEESKRVSKAEEHRLDLIAIYGRYNDAALLGIEAEELTEVARDVLREEIGRRGIETLIDDVEFREQQLPGSTLVEVWTGATIEEAVIVLHLMEIANIQTNLLPVQGRGAFCRFKIEVDTKDAECAAEVIAEGTSMEYANRIVSDFKSSEVIVPVCRSCASQSVVLEALREGNCWSCQVCGDRWEEIPGLRDEAGVQPLSIQGSETQIDDIAKQQKAKRSNRNTVVMVVIGTSVGVIVNMHSPWGPLKLTALLFWICSEMLWAGSRWQLGSNFTARAEVRHLVTIGIYSRIRHPIYVFGTAALASLVVYFDRSWLLLFLLIVIPIQVGRARRESKLLSDAFGEKYQRYLQQTWF